MTLRKIISGGQTGADQGGLFAAELLGLDTGGWMPRGWRTDEGLRPDFEARFRLKEHESRTYPPRTRLNVRESEGTLIVGDAASPGCRLTIAWCQHLKRPYHPVGWGAGRAPFGMFETGELLTWLERNAIEVLNVAGNRERTNPGIFEATRDFLIRSLGS